MGSYALEVKDIYKKFRIFHEKRNSLYESLAGSLSKKKYYEDLDVLKSVSFELKKGEMLGIIGPNGSGKTTLLRIISRVYQADRGQVKVYGNLIPFLSLGLGFQNLLTTKSNIIQYGMILGLTKSEISNRVDEVIKFAELEKFADTKLKNFSSGMYVRLAFATAVQVDPDILIIDEAISVGDIAFQKKSFDTILDFKKKGKAIIFVSHDMNLIKSSCDSAIFLNNGVIEKRGKTDEVVDFYYNKTFSNPKN